MNSCFDKDPHPSPPKAQGVPEKNFALKFIEVGVRAAISKAILRGPARRPHLRIDLTCLETKGNCSPHSHLNAF